MRNLEEKNAAKTKQKRYKLAEIKLSVTWRKNLEKGKSRSCEEDKKVKREKNRAQKDRFLNSKNTTSLQNSEI